MSWDQSTDSAVHPEPGIFTTECPQPGGARRGRVTSGQVLTVPGRPERGDEVLVRHTCRGADGFDPVEHVAALPVSRVVRLGLR